MKKELDLIENKELREECINRIEVLEKVKQLLLIDGADVATMKQVADFYEVGLEAVNSLVKDHREEIEEDGLLRLTGKETREFLSNMGLYITNYRGHFECGGHIFANRNNLLFNKKAILHVGLLLQDSEVAHKVRLELGLPTNYNIKYRKECSFLDFLETCLSKTDAIGIRQYSCCNNKYRIDYYIENYKLAIEYDENDHSNYTYEQQEGRQKEIEEELGCTFVRLSDKNEDKVNFAIVLSKILEYQNHQEYELYLEIERLGGVVTDMLESTKQYIIRKRLQNNFSTVEF